MTNAFSWLSDPGYAKNLGGLIQALTVGLPQYSATPSWMFFRNSLISDLLFTLLFVISMNFGRSAKDRVAEPRGFSRSCGITAMQLGEQRDEVEMLSLMLLIRRFEERASQQYQAQKIGGFCHLYIGQEAVVQAPSRQRATTITSLLLIATMPMRWLRYERERMYGGVVRKRDRLLAGVGGSMHFFDRKNHMYGGHAIVGAHVPLAVGMAFAAKYRG